MKYYIKRDLNEYGPYTLADLQRYVAAGNIALTDFTRSEGMADWVPVSQVLGNMPAAPPQAPTPGAAAYAGGPTQPVASQPAAMQPGMAYGAAPVQQVAGLVPPDFHWALVLVIGFFCGLFTYVWLFIEAAFIKKLKPQSNFIVMLIVAMVLIFGGLMVCYGMVIAQAVSGSREPPIVAVMAGLGAALVGVVFFYVAIFQMRDAMQDYYNRVEPINLRLSGVMTFFFSVYYFQHHFSRIAQWKKTGILQPQG
jgi:hypothetical protein